MQLVSLPHALMPAGPGHATSTDAKYVQDRLHFDYQVECPVKCIDGHLYVRISAHVYNQASDYVRLAECINLMA